MKYNHTADIYIYIYAYIYAYIYIYIYIHTCKLAAKKII